MFEVGNAQFWCAIGIILLFAGLILIFGLLYKKGIRGIVLLTLIFLVVAGLGISKFCFEQLIIANCLGKSMLFNDLKKDRQYEVVTNSYFGLAIISTANQDKPESRLVFNSPKYLLRGMRFKKTVDGLLEIEKKAKEAPKQSI